MASSKTVANLAESVATVAIAGLAGPLGAMGTAGAKETVKHAKAAYLKNAATRELHQEVEAAVLAWAANEIGDQGVTERGLGWAAGVIRVSAPDWEEITRLDFDAGRVAAEVIGRGRASHSGWHADYLDRDAEYAVAERAIKETYATLIKEVRADGGAVLAAVRACQTGIEEITRSQQELVEALVGGASAVEVMAYLRARIRDWDDTALGWLDGKPAPSILERQLRAENEGALIPADEALDGQRMLVVLGVPGAGKTWLAKRYARRAAQAALVALLAGADVADVEIPVYTTWDMWNQVEAGAAARQALVAASFDSRSGHSDLGGQPVVDRLKRTLTADGQPVLVVVDSLDEASAATDRAGQLRGLVKLHGWRVVVTSRPGAWAATTAGNPPEGVRVVTLQELEYPEDVEGFIKEWFAERPDRGDALLTQIDDRWDLRRSSRSPLFLTFLCILTDDAVNPQAPLPAMRRGLYQDLLRSLVRMRWANNRPGYVRPNVKKCLTVLTRWAWQAVKDANTPAGLGDWADTFTSVDADDDLDGFTDYERRAVDTIAPATNDEDRRFAHRTLLEHLVAEHVATLDTDTAAAILLPHLWYDPDWQIAAPAAIAAHNQNHPSAPGALLAQLLDQAQPPALDPARQEAAGQIDDLLLAVATDSQPEQWPEPLTARIHTARIHSAAGNPADVAATVHWTTSNRDVTDEVIEYLWDAGTGEVVRLAEALVGLDPTPDECAEVRAVIIEALRPADGSAVKRLVGSLVGLGPTPEECAEVRARIIKDLRVTRPLVALGDLADALMRLGPSPAEVRSTIIEELSSAGPFGVAGLAVALVGLDPTPEECAEARAAIIEELPSAGPSGVARLADALVRLDPTPEECAEVRATIIKELPVVRPFEVAGLVWALVGLDPTPEECAEARAAIIEELPSADPSGVARLADALVRLDPTPEECAEARATIIEELPSADPSGVARLADALVRLDPTPEECAEVRATIIEELPSAGPSGVARLAHALVRLDPTPEDRETVRAALMEALPAADPWVVGDLVRQVRRVCGLDAWMRWIAAVDAPVP